MIVVYHPEQNPRFVSALQAALPAHRVCAADTVPDDDAVRFAVVWNPPPEFFRRFAHLQAIFAAGAGVERLLARADLPADIPLFRLTDAGMAGQMIEYARFGVLMWQRGFDRYRDAQAQGRWQAHANLPREAVRVGVLGLGEMGGRVARELALDGYQVSGVSRTPRTIDGVRCLSGDAALATLLHDSDVLINLLPSTAATRSLLNADTLALLPRGAALVHAGRGEQLDEDALLTALQSGALRFALLDVFQLEPLPPAHPLWHCPGVLITPHVAAQTLPDEAARQIADKLAQLAQGRVPTGQVDRARGY